MSKSKLARKQKINFEDKPDFEFERKWMLEINKHSILKESVGSFCKTCFKNDDGPSKG